MAFAIPVGVLFIELGILVALVVLSLLFCTSTLFPLVFDWYFSAVSGFLASL